MDKKTLTLYKAIGVLIAFVFTSIMYAELVRDFEGLYLQALLSNLWLISWCTLCAGIILYEKSIMPVGMHAAFITMFVTWYPVLNPSSVNEHMRAGIVVMVLLVADTIAAIRILHQHIVYATELKKGIIVSYLLIWTSMVLSILLTFCRVSPVEIGLTSNVLVSIKFFLITQCVILLLSTGGLVLIRALGLKAKEEEAECVADEKVVDANEDK